MFSLTLPTLISQHHHFLIHVCLPLDNQFQQLKVEENVTVELRKSLEAYMMEAGLEIELLCGARDVLIQGLLWYFVVDKRRRELDDIAQGNIVCTGRGGEGRYY